MQAIPNPVPVPFACVCRNMPADMHSAVTVHSDMPAGTAACFITHIVPYCPGLRIPLPTLLHNKSPAAPASSVMFSIPHHLLFPVPV